MVYAFCFGKNLLGIYVDKVLIKKYYYVEYYLGGKKFEINAKRIDECRNCDGGSTLCYDPPTGFGWSAGGTDGRSNGTKCRR